MANPGFELLFENLHNIGFFEFFLPVILFLAIYYGLLMKTQAIGDDEAVVGAASIALSFATTFGLWMVVPASFFQQFFALVATVLIAVLSVALIAGMTGLNISDEEQRWIQLSVLGAGVLIIVLALPGLTGSLLNVEVGELTLSGDVYNFILMLALIGTIGYTMKVIAESE